MHFYSIHVIVEYNQAGSEIICRQIHVCKKNISLLIGLYKNHHSVLHVAIIC